MRRYNHALPAVSGVYQIRNIASGDIYVGSSVQMRRRETDHLRLLYCGKHTSAILNSAWAKYGADSFVFEVLETCDIDILIQREQHYIDTLMPRYNIAMYADSPFKGRRHTPECRDMISAQSRAMWEDPAFRELWIAARMGYRHTEETKRKISTSHKRRGKVLTPEHKQKLLEVNLGRTASAETRAKMSESRKGRTVSPETREKLAASRRGKPRPPHVQAILAECNKNRVVSEKTREKMRQSHLGLRPNEETRQKLKETQRRLAVQRKKQREQQNEQS